MLNTAAARRTARRLPPPRGAAALTVQLFARRAAPQRRAAADAAAPGRLASTSDEEVLAMMKDQRLKFHGLEAALSPDYERAIRLRREFIKNYIETSEKVDKKVHRQGWFDELPYKGYDWTNVVGSNCENIIGYVPIPLGIAGPILMDGKEYPIPMATTEGALVASTHRGARCISRAGGCRTRVLDDGMTRAPVVELPSMDRAADLAQWMKANFADVKMWFEETTSYGKLTSVYCRVVGRKVYVRFRATTGDAMGMNMISKATDNVLTRIATVFQDMKILSLSGNFCTDKKPSAVNWIEGRGKCVVAETVIPASLVREVLKCDVDTMVGLNIDKNLIGSAMAGSIGGFNAHAANAVAAIFLASGQDPAQVVESSTAITVMERAAAADGEAEPSLRMSVTMPSIEVGTVGGGATLPAQRATCELVGCAGASPGQPGANAQMLARVVCAGVLSAELSLMAGLAAGHLVRAHMKLGRGGSAAARNA